MNVNISNFMEERKANTEEAPYMEMKVSLISNRNSAAWFVWVLKHEHAMSIY